jgi:two-component system, NarL family, response regulator DevR
MEAARTNVYIVDDSDSIRSRLGDMLRRIDGVDIVGEAATAADAIAGILDSRPHGVLLDLHLTGRSGIDVLRAVHPQAPEVVFIVLTNHAEEQYRKACAKAGARYFLDKSCDFERVPGVIAEIAAHSH